MKYFRALLLTLAIAAPAAHAANVVEADRLVAVVNNEAITRSELQIRLRQVMRQLKQQNTDLPPADILEKQVLERMILDLVQAQTAREDGIKVDDSQLEMALSRIAESNKMPLTQFRQALEKDGLPWSAFREEIRKEIVVSRLREREVDSHIIVSDGEVENYLANNQQGSNDEFLLQQIFLRAPEQASPEQLQKLYTKAQLVMEKLAAGLPFAKAAASYSDGNEAMNGGSVGWRSADRLPGLFADALKTLQPGGITPIFRSPAGFHILRLAEKRTGGGLPKQLQRTHVRHILVKTNELVSQSEAEHKLQIVKERLDHGGNFAELARQYSNDLSSAKGGDLGWLYAGDTVPEFERAMDALKPGEISRPIQSPFGFHLIQVLERKVEDVPQERKQAAARQVLKERKAEEAYQDWLRQMRDRAYVEYRLDDK